jgi:hypothetical protein
VGDPDLAAFQRMGKNGSLPVVLIRPAEHNGGKASTVSYGDNEDVKFP